MPELGPMPTSTPLGPIEVQFLLNAIDIAYMPSTLRVPAPQAPTPEQLVQLRGKLSAMLVETETLGA